MAKKLGTDLSGENNDYTDTESESGQGKSGSSSLNPSKTPLNHINNMKEWEATLERYTEMIRKKNGELRAALELKSDAKSELTTYKTERIALDIDLHENVGSLRRKLYEYVDFIDNVYNRVKDLLEKENDNDNGNENGIPMVVMQDPDNNNIIITTNRNLTDLEQSNISKRVINEFQNAGMNITDDTSVEFLVQADLDLSRNRNTENTDEETKDVVEQYLKIINPDIFDDVLKRLKYLDKIKLKKLKRDLKKDIDEYFELCSQIDILSNKINTKQNEYLGLYKYYNNIGESIHDYEKKVEKESERFFLNSYLSTKKVTLDSFVSSPLVKKQIANIINLAKKGLQIPRTILLYGQPDLGKSYAASVLSTELGRNMFHIKSYDVFEGGFGDPNQMLDMVFNLAIKRAEPCVIFLDEMEKLSGGSEGSQYQKLLENTIRHHISKIKESNLDIIIIGAVSEGGKLDPSLLKQDVFSKQIIFEKYGLNECKELFQQIISQKGLNIEDNINLDSIISKLADTEGERNPEYIKKLIDMAEDYHVLNSESLEFENTISSSDIMEAIKLMKQHNCVNSEHVGFKG